MRQNARVPTSAGAACLRAAVYLASLGGGMTLSGPERASAAEGGRYALLVGVEKYDPKFLVPLEYAEDDMEAVGAALANLGFKVVTMTSSAEIPERRPVTADDIMAQLDRWLKHREPEDTVVLAFSGHGVQLKGEPAAAEADRETWFCPERARLDDPATLLPMTAVVERLRACPAKQKLLLVDACRAEVEPKAIRDKNGVPTIELDAAAPLRRRVAEGMGVLFSCGPREKSYELDELGHSVFTHFVINYLGGRAEASRYSRQRPMVNDLQAYVSKETREYVGWRLNVDQNPEWVVPEGRFSDWSLGTLLSAAVVTNSIGMKLVPIDAGEFQMGSNDNDDVSNVVRRVKITKPFRIGQTEVTQGQFERVMGTTPWRGKDYVKDGPTIAATYVSWDDAVEFCRKLTEIEWQAGRPRSRVYRLPTEAEWEYACRAGTDTKFAFGDDDGRLEEHAWWGGFDDGRYAGGGQHAREVGGRKPNAWNVHDMHGNALEWCSDWLAPLAGGDVADPAGPPSPTALSPQRVVRGGSWGATADECRSGRRDGDAATARNGVIGFRVVQAEQ